MAERQNQEPSIETDLMNLALICRDAERLAGRLSPDYAEEIEDGMAYAPTSIDLGGRLSTTIGMAASRVRTTYESDGIMSDSDVIMNRYSVETQLKVEVEFVRLPEDVKDQLEKVVETTALVPNEATVYEVAYGLNYTFADDGTFDPDISIRYLADGYDIVDDEGEPLLPPDTSDTEQDDEREEDKNLAFLTALSKEFEDEFKQVQAKDPIHIIETEVAQSIHMSRAQHIERCTNLLRFIDESSRARV